LLRKIKRLLWEVVCSGSNNIKDYCEGNYLAKRSRKSESRKVDDKVHAASLYARSLLEASLDPLVTISAEGKITDVNNATELITGCSRENLVGSNFSDYFTEPEKARVGYTKLFTEGFVKDYPLAIHHKSGKITNVLYNASIYRNEKGEMQGIFAAAREITDVTKVHEALRITQETLRLNSEQRWATTLASIGDAVIATDIVGKVMFMNGVAENLTGWTLNDALQKPVKEVLNIINEQTRSEVENPIAKVLKEGKVVGLANHTVLIRKDRSEVPIDDSGAPVKDKEGKITGVVLVFRDITKRKQQEHEIASIAKFPSENPNPIFRLDRNGTILYGNQAGTSFLKMWKSKVGEHAPENISQVVADALASDKKIELEETFGAKIFSLLFVPIRLEGYVNIYASDITERKEAEEALKQTEQLYRIVFDNSQDGFQLFELIYDETGKPCDLRFLRVNRAYEKIMGVKAKDVTGKTTRRISPNCESYWFEVPDRVVKTGRSEHVELYNKDINKTLDCYYFQYSKNLVGTLFRDITERKKTEEKLRAASSYSRSLIEASLDPLVTISSDGKITDVNKATESVTGFSRRQLIGSDFSTYFTNPVKARKGYKEVFREGFVRDYPLAIKHKSGQITDVLYNATVYRNEKGEIQGVFAAAHDVTERKLAEQKLLAAYSYSRSLIEASLDPLVTISKEGKITDVNKATEDVTGCSRKELIGSDFSDYFTEPDQARAGYQKVFTEGYVMDYPLAIRHKFGTITDVLYNASVYRNPQGEIQGVFAAARDITVRKAMENEIKQTMEKLKQSNAELEQFAYVASHDLQEPLRMVASYVQLIERRYKGKLDPEADEFIAYAVDGANRMRGLIDDLLTYSRVSRLGKPFEQTNLESTLDAVLKNLQVSIAENDAVVTHDKLPVVIADGGQLVQLLQNLIGNAIKFHGKEAPRVHVSAQVKENEYLFSVRDNGIGIAPEYIDRLFKIFQRLHTREEYPGSGIGLAVCKKIVERHGGRIWIESQMGKGSTIYFTLNKQKGVNKKI
jgi:PAS domain S-box-containing protein